MYISTSCNYSVNGCKKKGSQLNRDTPCSVEYIEFQLSRHSTFTQRTKQGRKPATETEPLFWSVFFSFPTNCASAPSTRFSLFSAFPHCLPSNQAEANRTAVVETPLKRKGKKEKRALLRCRQKVLLEWFRPPPLYHLKAAFELEEEGLFRIIIEGHIRMKRSTFVEG